MIDFNISDSLFGTWMYGTTTRSQQICQHELFILNIRNSSRFIFCFFFQQNVVRVDVFLLNCFSTLFKIDNWMFNQINYPFSMHNSVGNWYSIDALRMRYGPHTTATLNIALMIDNLYSPFLIAYLIGILFLATDPSNLPNTRLKST